MNRNLCLCLLVFALFSRGFTDQKKSLPPTHPVYMLLPRLCQEGWLEKCQPEQLNGSKPLSREDAIALLQRAKQKIGDKDPGIKESLTGVLKSLLGETGLQPEDIELSPQAKKMQKVVFGEFRQRVDFYSSSGDTNLSAVRGLESRLRLFIQPKIKKIVFKSALRAESFENEVETHTGELQNFQHFRLDEAFAALPLGSFTIDLGAQLLSPTPFGLSLHHNLKPLIGAALQTHYRQAKIEIFSGLKGLQDDPQTQTQGLLVKGETLLTGSRVSMKLMGGEIGLSAFFVNPTTSDPALSQEWNFSLDFQGAKLKAEIALLKRGSQGNAFATIVQYPLQLAGFSLRPALVRIDEHFDPLHSVLRLSEEEKDLGALPALYRSGFKGFGLEIKKKIFGIDWDSFLADGKTNISLPVMGLLSVSTAIFKNAKLRLELRRSGLRNQLTRFRTELILQL